MRCDFSEVALVWKHHLWDDRHDFRPTSSMLYLGGYDASIATKYQPHFFKLIIDDELAGVNSGHATSDQHFRSRGLFVFEKFRGRGASQQLLKAVIEEARQQSFELIWTAPRQGTLPIYEKVGFERTSEFTNEGFLYGPNCYAHLRLI